MHPVVGALAERAQHLGLAEPSVRSLLAVSGGPDSVALWRAWMAASDAGMLPRPIAIAHFNHGMRGAQGDADARWVRECAVSSGLEFCLGRGDLRGANEGDARDARYRFLIDAAHSMGCSAVVTGHTADDQAETVLMRVLRGTSVDGLAGMPECRDLAPGVRVVRPMLGLRRSALVAYLGDQDLVPLHDPTNDDPRYVRGRLRSHWDVWEREFNPRLVDALCRLAEQSSRDRAWIGSLVDALWEGAWDGAALRVDPVLSAPEALRFRIWMRWVASVVPRADREAACVSGHLAGVDGVARQERTAWELPGGVRVVRLDGRLCVENPPLRNPAAGVWSMGLMVPGSVELPDGRVLRVGTAVPAGAGPFWRTCGPSDAGWVVRGACDGDRVIPLGMSGRKKVRDVLREAGIAAECRVGWPLVVCARSGRVAWVVGHCVSQEFRVEAGAGQVHWWELEN